MRHEPRCTGTKVCSECKRNLSVLAFSVAPKNSDGLRGMCRECRIEKYNKPQSRKRTAERLEKHSSKSSFQFGDRSAFF